MSQSAHFTLGNEEKIEDIGGGLKRQMFGLKKVLLDTTMHTDIHKLLMWLKVSFTLILMA